MRFNHGAMLVLSLIVAGACSESPTQPVVTAGLTARAGSTPSNKAAIQQFAEAQGTWCLETDDPDVFVSCNNLEAAGVGFLFSMSKDETFDPFLSTDFGGVNARWWAANRPFDPRPAYSVSGSVNESRLPDGRRHLRVTMKCANTFAWFATGAGESIIGADFFDYATSAPALATCSGNFEFVVPANYVGYPDLVEVAASGTEGMELRQLSVIVEVSGALRMDYDGLKKGTNVTLTGKSGWMNKLALRGVKSAHLQQAGYDPSSNFTLKVAR